MEEILQGSPYVGRKRDCLGSYQGSSYNNLIYFVTVILFLNIAAETEINLNSKEFNLLIKFVLI